MTKFCVVFLIYILTFACFAQDLDCQIRLNNDVVLKNKVSTVLSQKVLIGKSNSITAYVTEKQNQRFNIEAFLADYEVRLYAEGLLSKSNDAITASLWGRESIVDVSCRFIE